MYEWMSQNDRLGVRLWQHEDPLKLWNISLSGKTLAGYTVISFFFFSFTIILIQYIC
jgi:hypothetical protein